MFLRYRHLRLNDFGVYAFQKRGVQSKKQKRGRPGHPFTPPPPRVRHSHGDMGSTPWVVGIFLELWCTVDDQKCIFFSNSEKVCLNLFPKLPIPSVFPLAHPAFQTRLQRPLATKKYRSTATAVVTSGVCLGLPPATFKVGLEIFFGGRSGIGVSA